VIFPLEYLFLALSRLRDRSTTNVVGCVPPVRRVGKRQPYQRGPYQLFTCYDCHQDQPALCWRSHSWLHY